MLYAAYAAALCLVPFFEMNVFDLLYCAGFLQKVYFFLLSANVTITAQQCKYGTEISVEKVYIYNFTNIELEKVLLWSETLKALLYARVV